MKIKVIHETKTKGTELLVSRNELETWSEAICLATSGCLGQIPNPYYS